MKRKTKKAVAKRFSITANGKIKFKRAGLRHNLGKKKPSIKQDLRASCFVADSDAARLTRCIPYGLK